MKRGAKSAAVLLWDLLETGVRVPRGTGEIVCDAQLCVRRLAPVSGFPPDLLYEIFACVPVKETRAILSDAMKKPEEERIRYLRAWSRKRAGRRNRGLAA